ncbi:MAG: hypothetical protein M1371_01790 [Actinobacteria bacterium]|nr:hypothetical protein [Actinomycetota bacterium]
MKKILKLGIAVVAIVSMAYLVVGCAVGPASVDDVVVAESLDEAFKPVNPVDSYPAGATLFSISVKVSNLKTENKLAVNWFYKDMGEQINVTEYVPEKAGSGYVGFTLELTDGFPTGTYYAEIFLDGKLIKTVEWNVK